MHASPRRQRAADPQCRDHLGLLIDDRRLVEDVLHGRGGPDTAVLGQGTHRDRRDLERHIGTQDARLHRHTVLAVGLRHSADGGTAVVRDGNAAGADGSPSGHRPVMSPYRLAPRPRTSDIASESEKVAGKASTASPATLMRMRSGWSIDSALPARCDASAAAASARIARAAPIGDGSVVDISFSDRPGVHSEMTMPPELPRTTSRTRASPANRYDRGAGCARARPAASRGRCRRPRAVPRRRRSARPRDRA